MIYFITVNYYSTNLISKLISSIKRDAEISYRILIVNNSFEDYFIYDLKDEGVFIINAEENLGYGRACNIGLNWVYEREAEATVWIINPDTCLQENSLKQAAHFFEDNPDISVLGTTIYEPNGEVWFAGGEFVRKNGTIIGTDQRLPASLPYMKADWVSGCSMLINLKRFRDGCPQFDPDYFLYYEDFDFCHRYASQGHTIGVTRKIGVIQQPSSMTNRHLDLKLQHSICSYLIALEKHASRFVLLYRLVLTVFSALVPVHTNRKEAINKLKGVFMYCKRVVRRWQRGLRDISRS